ncbi:hypothetical protein CW362_07715 [Streptomyces populi]|uniref:histidine kinase n=1 Tax=Streptomyces populi TaxID=2058924 RepID=A0A2I0SUY8_9ACTN|nr:hypothetical protein CW362_07715 [Streptomyces populi]
MDALLTLARSQGGLQRREFVDLADLVRERLPDGAVVAGGSHGTGAGAAGPQEGGGPENSGPENSGPENSGPGHGGHEGGGPGDGRPRVRADLGSAPVLGDPQLIERLVVNLADNAVRHNVTEDGESWVRLWTGTEAGRPVLRIDNTGPVIPREQVAGLFQPFRRLGAERTRVQPRGKGRPRDGLGLGLSIVTAVATAHGGTVEAWPRSRGGLSVRVTFPPCAPPLPGTDRQGVGSAGR